MDTEHQFPIVGIGASAGGIEAFRAFFAHLPPHTGMSFIVVLHLARDRPSTLTDIIAHWTPMPVVLAADGMAVEVEHVYVIPPNAILTIESGTLRVRPPQTAPRETDSIDTLFNSLATERGADAIGIVLSGTGSDGALGLKAIKACGGFAIAQGIDGSKPEHGGMPDAAIATGIVDLVIPVEQIGERIVQLGARRGAARCGAESAPGDALSALRLDICAVLHRRVGHNFSHYKEATFLRRVRRRMQVVGLDARAYADRLHHDPAEVMLLFRDLLIGVTSFFRDTETFTAVEQAVLPRLFAGRGGDSAVRIWVPGCATGEEAYSLAIMVREYLDTLQAPPPAQVFATDIDEVAIGIARGGRYPAMLLRDVPPARLERFFTRVDDKFVVRREVRDLCTFSSHSVIRDPPFSRIDLISCRNLLIYLDTELQSQVIPALHYALVPAGILLLGGSETVSAYDGLFAPIDKKHRIFERRDVPSPPPRIPAMTRAEAAPGRLDPSKGKGRNVSKALQAAADRIRDRFSPPFALVSADGDAEYYAKGVGRYLEVASGTPTRNLIALARGGLRHELRAALRQAVETQQSVHCPPINLDGEGGPQTVRLTVEAMPQYAERPLFLVVFNDGGPVRPPEAEAADSVRSPISKADRNRLERDLRGAQEQNQSITEEYETAIEELRSANEELQSVNEELQSSKEELETSKEEIQSINEELETVNAELKAKVDALDHANSDLRNIFESTQVATIFLDRNRIIRGFTPAIAGIYNLIPSDHGRPLADIASHLAYDDLKADVDRVLHTLEPFEHRVMRRDGRAHYLMRILPYRAGDNDVEGTLLTFIDVTSIVQAEQHQRLLVDELNHRVKNMLTVVISLASQTLRRAETLEGFSEIFLGRLHALAGAYALLTRENWAEVPLHDVLEEQLTPYRAKESQAIGLGGPPVFLKPSAALALGMTAHELATNAVKYGALSVPEGRVTVTWDVEHGTEGDRVVWRWTERGGPAVSAPPSHGFGVTLIERSLVHELRGHAEISFASDGLQATLSFPAATEVGVSVPRSRLAAS